VHYPAAARARVYLAERRAVSLVFKFSRIAAVSTRVKRSDFYCISQLGSTAGNCAQRNILFYSVFTVSLPSFSPLSYLIFALAHFLSLSLSLSLSLFLSLFSLSLSLSHTHTHTLSWDYRMCPHCRTASTILFAMLLFRVSTNNFLSLATVSSHFRVIAVICALQFDSKIETIISRRRELLIH